MKKIAIVSTVLLVTGMGQSLVGLAQTEEALHSVRIIEPAPGEKRSEPFSKGRLEAGFYTGSLSVEDFGSNLVVGLEVTYYLNPRWFLQANYGVSEVDRAAFETSDRQFLSSSDRDFEYLSLVGAYRIVQGRSFFGERHKFDSGIYALLGPNRVSFAGNKEWGLSFGISYRMAFTDWLSGNLDFREHLFERDFIGDKKTTMNTEFRIGINAQF